MNSTLLDDIRSRGYWRINFRPATVTDTDELSLTQLEAIVARCTVRLRGWDYPHLSHESLSRLNDCIEAQTHLMDHRELWRIYTSSQFIYLRALREDWTSEDPLAELRPRAWHQDIAGPALGVESNLWLLAETFEFLSRLSDAGLYTDGGGTQVSLQLHSGSAGRTLWVEEPSRADFYPAKRTEAPVVSYDAFITLAELTKPKTCALHAAKHIFERFGWSPKDDVLSSEIERLYHL